jgi:hypothetical protein
MRHNEGNEGRRNLMKAILFVLLLISIISSWGCAPRIVNGKREWVVMSQVGLVVTVQNNCSALMSVESLYGLEVRMLPFGDSATIPIATRPLSGGRSGSRQIWVMVKAYDRNMKFLGSAEMRESVSVSRGTRDRLWQVDDLESPQRASCPASP